MLRVFDKIVKQNEKFLLNFDLSVSGFFFLIIYTKMNSNISRDLELLTNNQRWIHIICVQI